MLTMFSLHVFYGTRLTLENQDAKPLGYAVTERLQTTFEGRNMIWTGLLIGTFLVYHLLQFTFQVTDPGISANRHPDAMGRPDVFMMVVLSFRKFFVSFTYILAMGTLGIASAARNTEFISDNGSEQREDISCYHKDQELLPRYLSSSVIRHFR